ncbi:MAG: C-GCAxxG-C-C family protein [Acetobacteraceae bacterium]|nr:C-GCAxxG-C-C family protein [Acetobacteraceae bacterium]
MQGGFDAVAFAGQKFEEGYNCAESVLMALDRAWGLGVDPSAGTGLGGGLGREGHACGALTGGVIALSLSARAADLSRREARRQTIARASALVRWFRERAGAAECREIVGCDLSSPQGMARFIREGLKLKVCKPLVQAVVERLLESEGGTAGPDG